MKEEGLETTCVTRLRAYEFPVVPFSLTDAKGGRCRSVQRQINVLRHVSMNEFLKRASSLTELYEEEDIQWGGNLECQAAFDYLKQATIDGPSLRVVGATEPFKVEAEQFNYIPYVEDDPQVHRVEEEWEQMADIARVCLEEASRPMEERVDQKRCSLKFE
ncbi:uncharacterized protein E6C27_scaffold128G00700 [Cucumis melo var. makuwa]|uniref:Uncharacterized protein n=1 Tax=Cucumis melo var. makuwa TaxID=1194695 RepID=A0A5A7TCZ0_CUCMM|nr:uncharacterized protein E6C27_scaffold128G00700 [Cucumis melo var. makuwa]